jgi:hypothetical protein
MHKRFQVIIIFLMSALCLTAKSETLRWNVRDRFGVSAKGIQKAVSAAKIHFDNAANDVVILEFEKGSFWLEDNGPSKGIIDLSVIKPSLTISMLCMGVMFTA